MNKNEDMQFLQKIKYSSLIHSFEKLGYNSSSNIGKNELQNFLNNKTSSGHFDLLLFNKFFEFCNMGEQNSLQINKFIEDFLLFEEEVTRNAESFRIKYLKEKEIYNKILKQCEIYKSEKLNSEGFCEKAKIYGEITDIDIRKKLKGIKEIVLTVVFNNEKEELHFTIGGDASYIKKSFEFRPTSRKDHFEFIMKGINDRNMIFDIGSKIFPLTEITSHEEYFVQILIPEINNSEEIAAFINANIVLYMSDYKYYENLRIKQEKKLNKYKNAADKAFEYVKYVREIYGNLTEIKPELIVDFNNEKLMKRKGAKLNVNINCSLDKTVNRGNYYVEFNNKREIEKKRIPLKIEFNNMKKIYNPVIETQKIEYNYKTNYDRLIEKNIVKKSEQILENIEKENINNNIIQPISEQTPKKNDGKTEQENKNIKINISIKKLEDEELSAGLNNLIINNEDNEKHKTDIKNINEEKLSNPIESQIDLEKIFHQQNSEKNKQNEIKQSNNEIIQNNNPGQLHTIYIGQQTGSKFDFNNFIRQKYNNINKLQHNIKEGQNQITKNIIANIDFNTQQQNKNIKPNQIQENNITNNNITKIVANNNIQNNNINNSSKQPMIEYERESVYKVVNDISKKKTISSNIQTLEPIVNKVNYNVSVNKAIINQKTNQILISENTLPVSYLPEKVNKLIVSDQVTYLPLATTEKKVTYNKAKPIIHESKIYIKEGDENILNNLNNLYKINNNYNDSNNLLNNKNNDYTYLTYNNYNNNIGNNYNYNYIMNNNENYTMNTNSQLINNNVTTKRLENNQRYNNFQTTTQTTPSIQTQNIQYCI